MTEGQSPPQKEQLKLAEHHLTVSEYATKKNVSRAAVYKHIKDKLIVPDIVGMGQLQMIDWSIYENHTFAEPKWNEEKMRKKIQEENQ